MEKFNAHLKQKEIEAVQEITRSWRQQEADREKTFSDALVKVAQMETKLRQKASDLQRREERLVALEEELKQKVQQVGRELTLKEEEIMNVKKRFKEEKLTLESDKKRLTNQLEEHKTRLEQADSRFYSFKKDIDESPLLVLRQELATKNLELSEAEARVQHANDQRDQFKHQVDKLKREYVNLKK